MNKTPIFPRDFLSIIRSYVPVEYVDTQTRHSRDHRLYNADIPINLVDVDFASGYPSRFLS